MALPLHPEYGTEPERLLRAADLAATPRARRQHRRDQPRIPLDYLEYLFGPRVGAVLEKLRGELQTVRSGGESEMLQTLIAYEWQSLLGPFTVDPAQLAATGAGNGSAAADGLAVVEVPAKGRATGGSAKGRAAAKGSAAAPEGA